MNNTSVDQSNEVSPLLGLWFLYPVATGVRGTQRRFPPNSDENLKKLTQIKLLQAKIGFRIHTQ